jgi:hypothetical protein
MTDDYAAPTDEEWAVIEEQHQEAERIFRAATAEYFAAFEPWQAALATYEAELDQWIRLQALRTPVRDYVIDQLEHLIYRRPPTAKKIDSHHRPADVQKVLDDLIAEGKVRRISKGTYEWIHQPQPAHNERKDP